MHLRFKIESRLPVKPREKVKRLLRGALYPSYGFDLKPQNLTDYRVPQAIPAFWTADHREPFGVMMTEYVFGHYLLARAVIRHCGVRSWCDLGTGSATLPFQVARLGISSVFAVDGSDAALRAGKVSLPSKCYCVADITLPLDIREENGGPAFFDVVSALELVEHIPEPKMPGLLENIRRLMPRYILFAVGLQPDPPYHVNLKSMAGWIRDLGSWLPDWDFDEELSAKLFRASRRHARFVNEYPTNHLPGKRNLLVYRKKSRSPEKSRDY